MTNSVIDLETYNEIKELMEDSMDEFVQTYLSNSPLLISNMETALAAADSENMYNNSHQLKGGSGSIGALKLAELAMNIEKISKAGSTEGVEPLLAELKAEFERVEQELKALA